MSKKKPEELKVVILDNATFHKVKSLIIPELNPAELVWLNMKRKTTNKSYRTMEELKIKLDEIVKVLITEKFVKNLCSLAISLFK